MSSTTTEKLHENITVADQGNTHDKSQDENTNDLIGRPLTRGQNERCGEIAHDELKRERRRRSVRRSLSRSVYNWLRAITLMRKESCLSSEGEEKRNCRGDTQLVTVLGELSLSFFIEVVKNKLRHALTFVFRSNYRERKATSLRDKRKENSMMNDWDETKKKLRERERENRFSFSLARVLFLWACFLDTCEYVNVDRQKPRASWWDKATIENRRRSIAKKKKRSLKDLRRVFDCRSSAVAWLAWFHLLDVFPNSEDKNGQLKSSVPSMNYSSSVLLTFEVNESLLFASVLSTVRIYFQPSMS